MRGFPLVHAFGATLINHALGVAHNAVVVACAHGFQQLETRNSRSTRAIQNDFDVFDLFARQMQRVDQTRRTNHSCTVLVIVKDGNVHFLFQALLDDKAFRRLDVLKVDAAKRRTHQPDCFAELVGIFGIQLNVDAVHVSEAFEQEPPCLPSPAFDPKRPKLPKPKNRSTVGDHSNKLPLLV